MPTAKRVVKRTEVPPHPLAHLIPDPEEFEGYVRRQFGGYWDLDILRYAKDSKANTLLSGPTGPGKTMMVHTYAARNSLPMVTIQCNGGIDPNTFWGGPSIDPEGNLVPWVYSSIKEIIEHGGLLYIDECNFMHPRVSAAFHDLLDFRRQVTILEHGNETFEASDDLQVIASYNPDYEGTRPLNPAFKNRFKIKLNVDYSQDVEGELVNMPVLLELANRLRTEVSSIDTPVSTNMLMEFEELAIDLDLAFAKSNFLSAFNVEEREAVENVFQLLNDRLTTEMEAMREAAES
jgi:MoxR-like ATPase